MTVDEVVYRNGWLGLRTADPDRDFLNGFKPGEYELKKSAKRSLTANSYMWALCDEIGKRIGLSKNEVYRNAIREVGTYRDYTLTPEEAKKKSEEWSKKGAGWFAEQLDFEPDGEHVILRAYYGSRCYTSERFSRLISSLIEDARSVGIEPPDKSFIKELIVQHEQTIGR